MQNNKKSTPSAPTKTLPPKEASLFKSILKFYDMKQYKKGKKQADLILKKFPDHGETLAMKGLFLNCLDNKKEAYELVKKGLKNDIKSHICWHVFGILYRSDREYNEAIKCYLNALKHDSNHLQILRDLALLQIQMRDLKGFTETRRKLLTLKPKTPANWIAFTLAAHLSRDYALALRVLEAYEAALEPKPFDIETSEMLLYKNMIIEESGNIQAALDHLKKHQGQILDKLALQEKIAQFLYHLDRKEESEQIYHGLLKVNPENRYYHEGLRQVLSLLAPSPDQLTEEQINKLEVLYDDMIDKYPRANYIKYLQLSFFSGEKFKLKFGNFIKAGIRKGVPSLFRSLKSFYKDPKKVQIIEELILSYLESLKTTENFPDEGKETPLSLLWTLFFAAQHYDTLKQTDKALALIDEAITHTPTAVDLYLCKGRIYKHAGNLVEAATWFDKARKLDLADRYLNTKATLYFLRADMIEKADKTISLFTKDGDSASQNNLFDMQCMWYEKECGDAYYRLGAYGKALKKYTAIDKHFADISEDQFDFHTYCLRRMTLRAYIRLLRLEDHLYGHNNYFKSASGIINCYLQIYDNPKKDSLDDLLYANMTEVEKKKAKSKQRKVDSKTEASKANETKPETNPQKGSKDDKKKKQLKPVPVDLDPEGEALLKVKDPLAEATKFLRTIQKNCPLQIDTHLLAFEVFFRKKKYLLALQAVKRALSIDANHPSVHKNKIRLFHLIRSDSSHNEKIKTVFEAEAPEIIGSLSLQQINDNYLDLNAPTLSHRVSVAEVTYLLDPSQKEQALKIITDLSFPDASPKLCAQIHQIIQDKFEDKNAAEQYKAAVHHKFPHATYFVEQSTSKPNVSNDNSSTEPTQSANTNQPNST